MEIFIITMVIIFIVVLFVATIIYWIEFEEKGFNKRIKTKKELLLTFVTFYWWYKIIKEKYEELGDE